MSAKRKRIRHIHSSKNTVFILLKAITLKAFLNLQDYQQGSLLNTAYTDVGHCARAEKTAHTTSPAHLLQAYLDPQ